MSLGSNNGTPKIYLSVGFGKIRQKQTTNGKKVDSETPGAVVRETQQGKETWAIEHDFVSGKIEKIFLKESKEYGNSFEVVIADAVDEYQLSFTEDSRFWFDFMKKLPNVDLSQEVKLTAYDFIDKEHGKRRAGMSVEQGGKKILSYYDEKVGETWKLLHGFPSAKGVDFKDADETKMYFIKVKKFLRGQFNEMFAEKWSEKQNVDNEPDVIPETPKEKVVKNKKQTTQEQIDDLPF